MIAQPHTFLFVGVPANIDDPKQRIRDGINNIPATLCQRVFQHLPTCIEDRNGEDGQHMSNIICKQ